MKLISYLLILIFFVSCKERDEKSLVRDFLNDYVTTKEFMLRGEVETGSLRIKKSQFVSDNPNGRENYDFLNLLLLAKNHLINYKIKDTIFNEKKIEIYKVNLSDEAKKLIIHEDSIFFYFKVFELQDLELEYYEKKNDTFWIKANPKEIIKTSVYNALDKKTKEYIKINQTKRLILTRNGNEFKIIKGIIWE
jgi:hypothetical protein